jgi:predicted amidohydrolase
VKVCLIPMRVQPQKRSANLSRALDLLEQVGMQEPAPDLVVFPECLDLGMTGNKFDPTGAEPQGGPFVESLAERARSLGLFVAAGVTELEGECFYSCSVLIDADGDTIAHHRRIAVEPGSVFSAGCRLAVHQTPLGRVGLLTGEDLWQAPLPASLSLMGADLLIVPSSTSQAERSASEIKKRLTGMLPSTDTQAPAVISVAASTLTESSGKSVSAGYSFCRDAAGNLNVYEQPDGEEIIHLEVRL